MKRIYLFGIILVLISQLAYASNKLDIRKEFAIRKLIIVLQEEHPEQIEKLSKSGTAEDVQKYKSNINLYNTNLKNAFSKYWTDLELEFLTQSKVELLKNEDLLEYSILDMMTITIEGVDFFVFNVNFVYAETDDSGNTEYKLKKAPFKVNIQNEIPSIVDLCFLISNMKIYMGVERQFNIEKLEEVLARKTLLIDKGFLKATEEAIKKNYAFPYSISTYEEILDIAEKNDPNSLYLRIGIETRITNEGPLKLIDFMIVDCETGKILSRCNVSGTIISLNESSENSQNRSDYFQAQHKAESDVRSGLTEYYKPVYTCPYGGDFVGEEIARLYTPKAKLRGSQLKHMSSVNKQKRLVPLMIY